MSDLGRNQLSSTAFWLYSPISILGFPVTVLATNSDRSWLDLSLYGVALTTLSYLAYLPFVWISKIELRGFNFVVLLLTSTAAVGAFRGLLFFYLVEILELSPSGGLTKRILASTFTTVIWLSVANLLINGAFRFRLEYQRAIKNFLLRNLSDSGIPTTPRGHQELNQFQIALSKDIAALASHRTPENLSEIADLITHRINSELRPLSQRIWIRSLDRLPAFDYRKILEDALRTLDFSRPVLVVAIAILALVNNVFIRSFNEAAFRTGSFLLALALVLWIHNIFHAGTVRLSYHFLFLISVGVVPVVSSEYFAQRIGYSGDWTAALLITPVVPVLIVIQSILKILARDFEVIFAVLQEVHMNDLGDRDLASYIHNSLQSELLALASQLKDAANERDQTEIPRLLHQLSTLFDRSFLEGYRRSSQRPLERLESIRKSWEGILQIDCDLPIELVEDRYTGYVLVQLVEEFASNSFRHGKASRVSLTVRPGLHGIEVTLRSNGKIGDRSSAGVGSQWLDQVSLTPWNLTQDAEGTRLTLEI